MFTACKRAGCSELRDAPPAALRQPGYCSHRCAALDRQLGVAQARELKRQMLARVAGMTPLDAFRLGYTRGLESKIRQLRKRYHFVKKTQEVA